MRRLGAALGLVLVLGTALPGGADAASVAQSWAVDAEPFGVTVDPRDGRVFVANSDSFNPRGGGILSIIDPRSPNATAIAVVSRPIMSVVDPSLGRLFVTTASNRFLVIALETMSVQNERPDSGGLGIAVDQETHRVYATWSQGLSVFDGGTGLLLTRLDQPVGDAWWAVALDSSTHRIYLTNLNLTSPSLVVLDDRDLSLVANIPLPELPRFALAVDTARQLVYVSGYTDAGHLYVIDATSLEIVRTIQVGSFPISATFTPGTDRLYISNVGSRSLSVIDTATFDVLQTIALPWQPGQAALHPDGRLYVAGFDARLVGAVVLTNSAPAVDSLTLSPSPPRTNDVLQSSVAAHDADGDALTYSYEWLRNGTLLAGASGPSLDLSVAGHGDRGDTITVRVTASDGQTTSAPVSASVVIANTAPTASVVLDLTAPTTNEVLTATATASDADGDSLTYAFNWKVNDVVRASASSPNSSSSFDLAVAGNGDRGQTVQVEVVVSDGTLDSPVATASAVVANSSPTVTVSVSDATPESRDVLVATANAQDADADPLALTYTWSVNSIVKQTGASNSFDLAVKGQGDNGDVITVIVTASDGSASATASASATVTPGRKH
jgi:YVTN family beta-propeller protein